MGYMTTITILNDAWETIKSNPEQFIDNISKGMNGITHDRKYGHSGGVEWWTEDENIDIDKLHIQFET